MRRENARATEIGHMMLFDIQTIAVFMLVLFRISALMLTAPFFSDRAVPDLGKLAFSLVLAIAVMPTVPVGNFVVPTNVVAAVAIIFRELLIGISIGYAAQVIFAGILLAGQVSSFQMGLALARAFDPSSGAQSTVIAVFYRWVGLIAFIVIDGHHQLIRAVVHSYDSIALGQAVWHASALQIMLNLLADLFRIAIQVAAPALVVLFFTKILLALLNRAIPQMHVFLVGLPLTLTLGFITLSLSFGGLIYFYPTLFDRLYERLFLLTRALGS